MIILDNENVQGTAIVLHGDSFEVKKHGEFQGEISGVGTISENNDVIGLLLGERGDPTPWNCHTTSFQSGMVDVCKRTIEFFENT